MTESIDYYSDPLVNISQNDPLLHREKLSLKLIQHIYQTGNKVVDIGCGEGKFLLKLQENGIPAKGCDFSKGYVKKCQSKKLDVIFADTNKSFPYNDKEFDIVYCGEVLEHMVNPDHFIQECFRILKEDGHLILTTPNLLAWYNRILMLGGVQPIPVEYSTIDSSVGAGIWKSFKKRMTPVGHIRVFTFDALRDILKMHGFTIKTVQSAIFDTGFPKVLWPLEHLFCLRPSMGSNFIALAQKKK